MHIFNCTRYAKIPEFQEFGQIYPCISGTFHFPVSSLILLFCKPFLISLRLPSFLVRRWVPAEPVLQSSRAGLQICVSRSHLGNRSPAPAPPPQPFPVSWVVPAEGPDAVEQRRAISALSDAQPTERRGMVAWLLLYTTKFWGGFLCCNIWNEP